jgi:hypothetical protein
MPTALYQDFDMRFGDLSFGSIQIDGAVYEHDVVVDRGKSASAGKSRRASFAASSGTPRSPSRRRFPGDAAGW